MRALLASGAGEERAIALAAFAVAILFVGSLPDTIESARFENQPVAQVVGLRLGIALFFMPLVLYGIAALGHLVARFFGITGRFIYGRLSCFWALVVSAPVILIGAGLDSMLPEQVTVFLDLAILLIWLRFWIIFSRVADQSLAETVG